MSNDRTNQFPLFTPAGAYMQAMDQANCFDRLAHGAPRSSKRRSATRARRTRPATVWRRPMAHAWGVSFGLGVIALGIGLVSM